MQARPSSCELKSLLYTYIHTDMRIMHTWKYFIVSYIHKSYSIAQVPPKIFLHWKSCWKVMPEHVSNSNAIIPLFKLRKKEALLIASGNRPGLQPQPYVDDWETPDPPPCSRHSWTLNNQKCAVSSPPKYFLKVGLSCSTKAQKRKNSCSNPHVVKFAEVMADACTLSITSDKGIEAQWTS